MGPLTFTGASAPGYLPAKITILATLAASCILSASLVVIYHLENKRRDRLARELNLEHVQDIEFMDLTDKMNPEFRVSRPPTWPWEAEKVHTNTCSFSMLCKVKA
jgi:hypothetical protein